ncbi:MAG: hypothetical protein IJO29_05130 [Oscillospiraceae bacterium]|nr:hypothetical protein [Oscillospiraceae bacterium]
MQNSFLRRLVISLCIVLSLVGVVYIVFTAVGMYKDKEQQNEVDYKGFSKRFPLDNVSVMIPDEFEVVYPENVDDLETGESLVVPYDEYYTWKESTYVGMVCVSKEQNTKNMEPRAYMEAAAIPTYEDYYSDLGFEVVAREAGKIAGYSAAALTFKYTVAYEMGVTKTFCAYSTYLSEGGHMYTMTFVCEEWDFDAQKPTFDKIAESIKIGDSKPVGSESAQS